MKIVVIIPLCFSEIVPQAHRNCFSRTLTPIPSNLIRVLELDRQNTYFIISSSAEILQDIQFERNGINYSIIALGSTMFKRGWPYLLRHLTGFYKAKKKLGRLIECIEPDVLSVHGTYGDLNYAASKINIPKMLTIDMFYDVYAREKGTILSKLYAYNESRMLKSFTCFTYRTDKMRGKIEGVNPNNKQIFFGYPLDIDRDLIGNPGDKLFDVVFAARLHKYKGVEEFIRIVKIMVGLGGEITALIVGAGDIEYIAYLKKLISENGLSEIIELKANIESHRVFLQHLSQAKLNVYPVVETMTSGTIIESMAVGTPIITYKSDVNARLNAKRASLREVDFDEIMIAKEALMLLSNNDMLEAISQAGLETYYELFNRSDNEVLESYINALEFCINND